MLPIPRTDSFNRFCIFNQKAILLYNGLYKYDETSYTNSYTKMNIFCSEHGLFTLSPKQHLSGSGCPKCKQLNRTDKSTRKMKFIQKAASIHNHTYDYADVKFINSTTPVAINCSIHGRFYQTPKNHTSGCGCQMCAKELRSVSFTVFIARSNNIHQNKYTYIQSDKNQMLDFVDIICPIHGIFNQRIGLHLSGKGCKKCGDVQRRGSAQVFIEKANKIHNNKYDYSAVNYTTAHAKVSIICPTHGVFVTDPTLHISSGTGCPNCGVNYSKGNEKIKQYLITVNVPFLAEHRFFECRNKYPLPFDFYLPIHNILIEFDGSHHLREVRRSSTESIDTINKRFKQIQYHDSIKDDYAATHNINLIRIHYNDFGNIESILTSILFPFNVEGE